MGWHDPHCQGCEVSRSEASAATSCPALSCCSMLRWHSDSQLPSVSAFAEGLQGHRSPWTFTYGLAVQTPSRGPRQCHWVLWAQVWGDGPIPWVSCQAQP